MPLPKSILCTACERTYPEGWRRCPYCKHDPVRTRQEADAARRLSAKLRARSPEAPAGARPKGGGKHRGRPQQQQTGRRGDSQRPGPQRDPQRDPQQRRQQPPLPGAPLPVRQEGEGGRPRRRRRRGRGRGEGAAPPEQAGQQRPNPRQDRPPQEPRAQQQSAPRQQPPPRPQPEGAAVDGAGGAKRRRSRRRRRRGGGGGGPKPPASE